MFENMEQIAEGYRKKYGKYIAALETGLVSRAVGINEHHVIQLGKQLDNFQVYTKMLEANNSLNSLGELPKVALEVITAAMSNSVMPVIASTQTLEQQKGIIYFKNVKAETTKGNMTAGQNMVDPRTGMKTPVAYSGNLVAGEVVVASTVAGQKTYTATLAQAPIRSQFLKIAFSGSADVYAEDVGPRGADKNIGTLLGSGLSGTINYTTGAINLKFADDPTAAKVVTAAYQQNLEEAADVAKISTFMDSTMIEAEAFALKSVVGIFQQFALRKQFGDSYLEDMSVDLTKEMNAELAGRGIQMLNGAFGGTATTFSKALPVGAAYTEKQYRENYALKLADVERAMIAQSGRGAVKVMVVGADHAAFVRGLEGFQVLSDGSALGAHIFGTYKGITYVRVPETAILGGDEGIALYSGASALEAPLVYAPFMPLTVLDNKATGANPLQSQTVAATMAGLKVVVPQFIQKLNLVP